MSRGVRHDASGRFYSEVPKEDDDPFKNISTEELRRRAIDEEAVKESERALYARNDELRRFLAETPAYVILQKLTNAYSLVIGDSNEHLPLQPVYEAKHPNIR